MSKEDIVEEIDVEFAIYRIKESSFQIRELSNELKKNLDQNPININIHTNVKISPKEELLIILLQIVYQYPNEENPYLNYNLAFEYKVKDLEKVCKIKDNKATIPDQLLTTLISISISTARGLVISKTSMSNLRDIYIPILNPNAFLDPKNKL